MKSVEVDIVTSFIRDEVESFSDAVVYNDDFDSEEKEDFEGYSKKSLCEQFHFVKFSILPFIKSKTQETRLT